MKPTSLQAYKPTSLQAYKPTSLQAYKPTSLQAYKPTSLQYNYIASAVDKHLVLVKPTSGQFGQAFKPTSILQALQAIRETLYCYRAVETFSACEPTSDNSDNSDTTFSAPPLEKPVSPAGKPAPPSKKSVSLVEKTKIEEARKEALRQRELTDGKALLGGNKAQKVQGLLKLVALKRELKALGRNKREIDSATRNQDSSVASLGLDLSGANLSR